MDVWCLASTQDASYHQDYDIFCGEFIPYIYIWYKPLFTAVTSGFGLDPICKLPKLHQFCGWNHIWLDSRRRIHLVFSTSTTKNPWCLYCHMDVSKNGGTPKSSILIGFSIINHPFWGTPIFGNTHIVAFFLTAVWHVVPSADGIFLGWLALSVFCLTVGENSVLPTGRDFEGMERVVWLDLMVIKCDQCFFFPLITWHWLVAFPLIQLQQRYDVQFLVVRKPR